MTSRKNANPQSARTVGIMVCPKTGEPPIPETGYFRSLTLLGRKLGLLVFVFYPHRVDWIRKRVVGYSYSPQEKRWTKGIFPVPDIVYDRCFYSNPGTYTAFREPIRRLQACPDTTFLGLGLKGKWHVHQMLERNEDICPHLPETELLQRMDDVVRWLDMHGELILKPQGGSHGKGVLYVGCTDSGEFVARGRTLRNESIRISFSSTRLLLPWLMRFTEGRRYLIQRYLTLSTERGEAFDIRVLVQKNSRGLWELTGMAVRRGRPGSVTSNLHGGGQAAETGPFLQERYGNEQTEAIIHDIESLAQRIPGILEQYHGRLVELGIDIGVDADGRVWVLEVNSKPGRSSFAALPDKRVKQTAIRNPILYARYLLDRSSLRLRR